MRETITLTIEIEHDCKDRDDLVEAIASTLVDQEHNYACDHGDRIAKASYRIGRVECEGATCNAGF